MAGKAHRSGQVCPKGHYMDPNWEVCPYCEAEERSKKKSSNPEQSAKKQQASAGGARKTMVGQVPSEARGGGRETSAMPKMGSPGKGAGPAQADTRRIVAIMISYTWHPEGEVYPVREGRNYIGADRIGDDPSHRYCDIHVPDDEKMSGRHALILCRPGGYELIDEKSTNGTFLNGKMLHANESKELPSQAEIRAGKTVFTYMSVPQIPQETTPTPPREEPEPSPKKDKNYTRPT